MSKPLRLRGSILSIEVTGADQISGSDVARSGQSEMEMAAGTVG